jgi:hypothetical protein
MRLPGIERDHERRHFVALLVPGVAPLRFDRSCYCVGDDVLYLRAISRHGDATRPFAGFLSACQTSFGRADNRGWIGLPNAAPCGTS